MTNLILSFCSKHAGLIILLLGGIVLTIGDLIIKKWTLNNSWTYYTLGIIVWTIGLNFLAFSFRYKNIATASIIFVIFNIIILSIVGYLFFNEKLSGTELAGILLGLIAVGLMEA